MIINLAFLVESNFVNLVSLIKLSIRTALLFFRQYQNREDHKSIDLNKEL